MPSFNPNVTISVRRWLTAGDSAEVRCTLRPDDDVATAMHVIASAINAPVGGMTLWADVSVADGCVASDVACAIVETALARNKNALAAAPAGDVLAAMAERCAVRKAFAARLRGEGYHTFSRAVRLVSEELLSSRASVQVPLLDHDAGFNPNPFMRMRREEVEVANAPNARRSGDARFAATLESFCDPVLGAVRLNVAAADDVAAFWRAQAGEWKVEVARHVPPPRLAPPRDATGSAEPPLTASSNVLVRALHVEVGRLRWRRLAASTALFVDGLRAAFATAALSPSVPMARFSMAREAPQTRMLKGLSHALPPGVAASALRRHPARANDLAQIALFAFEPECEWCACLALTGGSAQEPPQARMDLYATRGALALEDVSRAIEGAQRRLLDTLWAALRWAGTCVLDARAWAVLSAHDDGGSQRLVAMTASASLSFDHVSPTAASVMEAMARAAAEGAPVANVQDMGGGVVAFQYTRADGFMAMTPAQQTVRLNPAVPAHVLANALAVRHGLEPAAAQQLVEEEQRKRVQSALERPQTFGLLKFSSASGLLGVTVRGATSAQVLLRVIDLVRIANSAKLVATHSEPRPESGRGQSQDASGGDEGDDDVPDELREALAASLAVDTSARPMDSTSKDEGEGEDADAGPGVPGRYVISELHRVDPKLFNTGPNLSRYSRKCAKTMLRQPIPVSPAELERIQRENPGAADSAVAAGSSAAAAAANRYICPQVWCPKSRAAMTLAQFERQGRRCPPQPGVQEEPLVFDNASYWQGRQRFPGFLDPKFHPEGLCMPCCFLKPGRKAGRCREVTKLTATKPSAAAAAGVDAGGTANARYIYGEATLLSQGRYGMLPRPLHAMFNAGRRCLVANTSHLTTRTSCVLRKGMAAGPDNMLDCLAAVLRLGVPGRHIPRLIRKNLDVPTFLALHNGRLAQHFVPADMARECADVVRVESFAAWLNARNEEDVRRFGLAPVRAYVNLRVTKGGGLTPLRSQQVAVHVQAMREYALFLALQGYLSAVDAGRTHEWVLDLVNIAPPWLNPRGMRILVLIAGTLGDEPVLACPVGAPPAVTPTQRVGLLARHNGQYEALCTVMGVRGGIEEEFAFDPERSPPVRALLGALRKTCLGVGGSGAAEDAPAHRAVSVVRALESIGERVDTQVLNYSLQCVGLVTAAGVLVPLQAPDSVVVDAAVARAAFVEEAIGTIFEKIPEGRGLDAHATASTLRRLAAALGSPQFEVVRGVPGGLLLRMGKVVPLVRDDRLFARYSSDASVFLNTDVPDARITAVRALSAYAEQLEALRHRFLEAVQDDAAALANLGAVCAATCQLPFDVRHAYVAALVRRFMPGSVGFSRVPSDYSALADRLLLGITRLPSDVGATQGHRVITFAGTDPATVERADDNPRETAGTELTCASTNRWSLSAETEEITLDAVPPALRELLSLEPEPGSRGRPRSSSARTSRASFSSSRSSVRFEVVPLPLTSRAVAVKLVHHLDTIVHASAPLPLATLDALAGPPGAQPLAVLTTLASHLGIAVARVNPFTSTAHVITASSPPVDLAVLVVSVENPGAQRDEVLLTRKMTRGSVQFFGALSSLAAMAAAGALAVGPS